MAALRETARQLDLDLRGASAAVQGFGNVAKQELLELPVDVLAPSAIENQITEANAAKVQAKIVVEGANGPTTPEADAILEQAGKVVVPDILANAGGVTVSYFEWVQNKSGDRWTADEVGQKLEAIMAQSTQDVFSTSQEHGVSLREAALILGTQRLADSIRARGTQG